MPLVESDCSIAAYSDIKGLMTIAPYVARSGGESVEIFRQLKKLSVDIAAKNINNVNMSVLSMGMTGDYHGCRAGGRYDGACWNGYFW